MDLRYVAYLAVAIVVPFAVVAAAWLVVSGRKMEDQGLPSTASTNNDDNDDALPGAKAVGSPGELPPSLRASTGDETSVAALADDPWAKACEPTTKGEQKTPLDTNEVAGLRAIEAPAILDTVRNALQNKKGKNVRFEIQVDGQRLAIAIEPSSRRGRTVNSGYTEVTSTLDEATKLLIKIEGDPSHPNGYSVQCTPETISESIKQGEWSKTLDALILKVPLQGLLLSLELDTFNAHFKQPFASADDLAEVLGLLIHLARCAPVPATEDHGETPCGDTATEE